MGKLFYSKSVLNYTKYSNPEVDALIDRAKSSRDAATRNGLYAQAEQIRLDGAVTIPIFWPVEHLLVVGADRRRSGPLLQTHLRSAPLQLAVPADVTVKTVNLALELEALAYHLANPN